MDIRFAVSDTGIGIPPNKIRQIFESCLPRQILKPRVNLVVQVLDLLSSRKIIDQMGGNLRLKVHLGSGSSFYFTLSFKITKQQKSYVDEDRLKELSGLDGITILLAEDNPINMIVAERFLQKWNIQRTGS